MSEKWKVLQRVKEEYGWCKVAKDKVELPSGNTIKFSFIEMNQGVTVLPIDKEGHVICIKQYRHPFADFLWELPAGVVEPGEEPLQTAKRELSEEIGYNAGEWLELGEFYPSPGSTNEVIHLFAAKQLKYAGQDLEETEQIEVYPIEWQRFLQMVLTGEIKHGGALAAVVRLLIKETNKSI